jgi:NAD(P)-dependent dehydrogenase (short-subunit alcohol dehydrogenase family)
MIRSFTAPAITLAITLASTLAGLPIALHAAEAPSATSAATPAAAASATPKAAQKAVLVTGASTGIGRKVTERLAADGYFVYAGARKPADLQALGAIKNVQAVALDVTKPADIDAAVATITKAGRGLYGLVNNAGIATASGLADMNFAEFDLVMAVNEYGPVRMTKAFLPLITAQHGRITNIGSISGILANPALTAYAMSKHALEAFTDSVGQQLAATGVIVNIVEPGNYNSDIGKNAALRAGGEQVFADPAMYSNIADRSKYKDPDEVAAAVELALFEPNPKRRYMVVPNQQEAEYTIRRQIRQLVELNEGQPYTYDRDALVKMLDEAMAHARPRSK